MIAKAKGGLEMELSERKKQILRAVVENYIQTAEPVGSKAIVAAAGLKVKRLQRVREGWECRSRWIPS